MSSATPSGRRDFTAVVDGMLKEAGIDTGEFRTVQVATPPPTIPPIPPTSLGDNGEAGDASEPKSNKPTPKIRQARQGRDVIISCVCIGGVYLIGLLILFTSDGWIHFLGIVPILAATIMAVYAVRHNRK